MTIIHSLYRESGNVSINPDTCTHCGSCAKICPAEVLMMDDNNIRVRKDSFFGCIACGHCMMVCPDGAITVTGRGISPEDLIPLADSETKANADEFAALLRSRRSVRRFSDREVGAKLVERIVELSASAPMGIPPWDVGCVIVRGRKEVQQIANEVIKGYEGFLKIFKPWLLHLMRPFMSKAKYEGFASFIRPLAQMYVRSHREGRDMLFYNAPVLLVFHHSPYADVADAAIACTYAMLTAESMGFGSTIIGGAPPIIQRNKTLRKKLGVPPANTVSLSLILGYPAAKFRRTIRRRFAQWGS